MNAFHRLVLGLSFSTLRLPTVVQAQPIVVDGILTDRNDVTLYVWDRRR